MELNGSHVEIKTNGAYTDIMVDGHLLNGVKSYTLSQSENNIPVLTVSLVAADVLVDQEALLDGTVELKMSNTPPNNTIIDGAELMKALKARAEQGFTFH